MHDFINEFRDAAAFDPETIQILAGALDDACKSLIASGAPFSAEPYRERAREIIAKRIIEMAKLGERDRKRLTESALIELANSTLKPEPPRRRT